jgi:hypothetical protein
MNKKIAIFAFNGEMMCFYHAMLNALDLHDKGYDVCLIIEGQATKLITDLNNPQCPSHKTYLKLKEKNILDCICKACANKMGTLEDAENQGLKISGDLLGHPSMAKYLEKGYEIISL